MSYRLGIDVGGTNTDAVILDEQNRVMAKCKRPSSEDISTGITEAVDAVLGESGINPSQIVHAMLGTTHSTNAIVERKGLARAGIIRLGAPSGIAVPPFLDWPDDIIRHIGRHYRIVHGGYEYNGVPIAPVDRDEIRRALEELKDEGITALAVSGVFSPVNSEQEMIVRDIAQEVLGKDVPVSLSSEVGSIGMLERENATILNAANCGFSLRFFSKRTAKSQRDSRSLHYTERRNPDVRGVCAKIPRLYHCFRPDKLAAGRGVSYRNT